VFLTSRCKDHLSRGIDPVLTAGEAIRQGPRRRGPSWPLRHGHL
jgi:hypothetical protein